MNAQLITSLFQNARVLTDYSLITRRGVTTLHFWNETTLGVKPSDAVFTAADAILLGGQRPKLDVSSPNGVRAMTDAEAAAATPLRDRLKAIFYALPPAKLVLPGVWDLFNRINAIFDSGAPDALKTAAIKACIEAWQPSDDAETSAKTAALALFA